ncbi:MAG: stage II sporulation protein M [Nanoarchaeota archaeon]
MLEMLINPRKAERRPWELFFVGAFYASLSILLVNWIFSQDAVLSRYSGILVVTFSVMFSMPFVYYTLKLEEDKITGSNGTMALLKEHKKAIYAFLWLFFGFVIALSFWYMVLSSTQSFRAQIETYCLINRPSNYESCVNQYQIKEVATSVGFLSNTERLFLIFTNNIYVLIFTLIFSLIFGAGVIFVLAWNASVIAAAIGIFTKSELSALPIALVRYMIHGIPEIASYFIVALAGGMVSIAVIKHETGTEKFWDVLQDSLNLIIIAVVVLFVAALVEVFITPLLF